MKAVVFTRVSSAGQEDGVSLDAQTERIDVFCQEKGFEVLETMSLETGS